ncbi:L,D-transpeptidase [Patescibacteria group bacterium]|nr:L,D-transpeptidase [Patescibacteria group bacterium]
MKPDKIFFPLLLISVAIVSFVYISGRKIPCANSITCIDNLSAVVEYDTQGIFLGQTIDVPDINLAQITPRTVILGTETDQSAEDLKEKHIYIDLSEQKLYAFEKDNKIFETLVSTGKWGKTPVGEYTIWIKIRSTKMSGGSGSDYYYLPNVPYVMFFSNDKVPKSLGYSLHGAYWHNNFGHEMSHGCINLREVDAKTLYDWASPTTIKPTTHATAEDPGTAITICQKIQLQAGAKQLCLNEADEINSQETTSADSTLIPNTIMSRTTSDGSMTLILRNNQQPDNMTGYTLWVTSQDSAIENLIYSHTMGSGTNIEIPFNSWSPDNNYFYVKKQTGDSIEYLVFKTSAEKFENDSFMNIGDYFVQAKIPYSLDEVTGWSAPFYLIIKTKNNDTDAQGPPYWFNVPQQTFI